MSPWKVMGVALAVVLTALVFRLGLVSEETGRYPVVSHLFSKRDVMIPMRDGVRLHTEIYAPKHVAGPLPFLITRTPYGLHDDPDGYSSLFNAYSTMFPDGYIFVLQDIRGRFMSEGKFVMLRDACEPPRPRCIDEGTDTYDTIDWLLKSVPGNNGRAGLLGLSYGGWLTAMALLHPHPALKATSEQAAMDDMFLGDDFHHNGAFRLSYGFEYSVGMETGKTNYYFPFDKYDTFEWYLKLGPLSNVDRRYFHGRIPSWEDFLHHPNYDQFWQKQAIWPYFEKLTLTVPNLNVAGWWDQEDFWGPIRIYEASKEHDVHHENYLVVGPWNHGGWLRGPGSRLGAVRFGTPTGEYFRRHIQARWFAYWLKERGPLPVSTVLTFQTGSDRWQRYTTWPPTQNIIRRKLYFRAGTQLSFDPPTETATNDYDSYLSDPAHPVPYRHRPVEETYGPRSRWDTWLVEDQRFAYLRPDTMAWETPVLDHNVTVTGDITAHLFAATSGTSSDWVVKLIDVYPQHYPQDLPMSGFQLMIAAEIFRSRFRHSFENPEPMTPNRPAAITIDLHTHDHTFLKGHRIMVQVQSTWFPLFDRNPQKYVPNIFLAHTSDYIATTQRIYHSRKLPSYIDLPVVTN